MKGRSIVVLVCASLAACTRERPADSPADSPANAARARDTAASTARAPAADCGADVMSGEGIGALRLGMTADSLRARCRVLRDTTAPGAEGIPARVMDVVVGGHTVSAEIDGGRVWRIEVEDPALRTSDSLGVGTPLARLLTLPGARALSGEGALFVTAPSRCGLSFRLSTPASAVTGSDPTIASLRRLPASTVVEQVLIVGCTTTE